MRGRSSMVDPNDPVYPRKRNQSELMALTQQMASLSQQQTGSFSMPSALENELIGGLTKREDFAARAMQGFTAAGLCGTSHKIVAEWCISLADALIAALNKNG
jgi:hypothetical protein